MIQLRTKNFRRITFSLPSSTISKLELHIPKNSRSKFIADLIEQQFEKNEILTYEEINNFWNELAENITPNVNKTAVELQREDRLAH